MGDPCLDVGQPCPFDEPLPLRTDELAPVVADDLRLPGVGQAGTVTYLHGDHLGSTSLATTGSGQVVPDSRTWYYPYGAIRDGGEGLPTDYTFTGQKDVPGTGLMYYGARYYEPALGRFVSADAIVPEPGNPQSLNRYSYVLGNPLRYIDPSGHYVFEEDPDDPWTYSSAAVRSAYYYTHPEYEHGQVSDAELFAAATSPVWVPAMLAAIPEVIGVQTGIQMPLATAAMWKIRLMFGMAGGAGSAFGYAFPSLLAGNFDWRECTVATGVGFVSGAFPDVGGSGVVGGMVRGALANEAQYVLSGLWTGNEMSSREAAWAAGIGGFIGALGGRWENKAFGAVQEAAEMYAPRTVSGAPRFASESLLTHATMARPAALVEGSRTLLWESLNNILQTIKSDLTTDYAD